jgi:hypothetical protein
MTSRTWIKLNGAFLTYLLNGMKRAMLEAENKEETSSLSIYEGRLCGDL